MGAITTDTTDKQKITQGYCKHLCAHKLQNLEEMEITFWTHPWMINDH